MSLYAKRLERGRFVWPSPADGMLAISAAQLAYMVDGMTGAIRAIRFVRSGRDRSSHFPPVAGRDL